MANHSKVSSVLSPVQKLVGGYLGQRGHPKRFIQPQRVIPKLSLCLVLQGKISGKSLCRMEFFSLILGGFLLGPLLGARFSSFAMSFWRPRLLRLDHCISTNLQALTQYHGNLPGPGHGLP